MSEPQIEQSAAGPMNDKRQQDDDQDDDHQPNEEHDDAGDGVSADCSSSSHGPQLPGIAGLIRLCEGGPGVFKSAVVGAQLKPVLRPLRQ